MSVYSFIECVQNLKTKFPNKLNLYLSFSTSYMALSLYVCVLKCGCVHMTVLYIWLFIIQHIDTLPKYGKMILDICHLHMTDTLRYLSPEGKLFFYETCTHLENRDSQNFNKS
jgi:hypothetical protein